MHPSFCCFSSVSPKDHQIFLSFLHLCSHSPLYTYPLSYCGLSCVFFFVGIGPNLFEDRAMFKHTSIYVTETNHLRERMDISLLFFMYWCYTHIAWLQLDFELNRKPLVYFKNRPPLSRLTSFDLIMKKTPRPFKNFLILTPRQNWYWINSDLWGTNPWGYSVTLFSGICWYFPLVLM